MTSGLEWDESDEIVDAVRNRISEPVSVLLQRDLIATPGDSFIYNSLSTHVLADILQQITNLPLIDYARNELFLPLGFSSFEWDQDPEGQYWGGFGLQLTARDLAKLGQLFLNQGQWNGQQLVSVDWIQEVTSPQVVISQSTQYSMQWWHSSSLDSPIFFGLGFGGQALVIIPDKSLVIVGLQEHFVSFEQDAAQWKRFVDLVLTPVYEAAE